MTAKRTTQPATPPPTTPTTPPFGQRVRQRRKELGLSLKDLAGRTGLTASFLSLVERNQNNPSLQSLHRLAEALEVPLFYFSQRNGDNPVVRHDNRVQITFPPGNLTCELLVPNLRNRLEVFLGRVQPSAGNIARTPTSDSEECLFVMEGRMQVQLADQVYELDKGDSIYFHGINVREIRAIGKREAVYISIITPPIL
ncbi:MAG TPA: XRE family transcriptional regulator [Anaerolineales bacterium]|nr:XRE family transcriptional regulator [Anaerolineales bacterium]HRF50361.1 XRE family transcriptional regulator [Anaerolineales bacterium]